MIRMPDRDFSAADAVRRDVPLLFGVFGAPGAGKTPSSIRIGVGMQQVLGGDLWVVDTEAGRALAYADKYKFKHCPMPPPHGSLDFLKAIKDGIRNGARVIVLDTFSHEHSGIGGLLDQHDSETERLAKLWKCDYDKASRSAWVQPKAGRKLLFNEIEQLGREKVAFVFSFRAKEKSDQTKAGKYVELGFMPETDENFLFMLTSSALLLPRSKGVPTWKSEKAGETMMIRLPDQFEDIFRDGRQLDEEHGRLMAEWSRGTGSASMGPKPAEKPPQTLAGRAKAAEGFLLGAKSSDSLGKRWKNAKPLCDELRDPIAQVDPHLYASLKKVYEECVAKFAPEGQPSEPPEGAMSIEYAKDLANRVEAHLLAENDGSKSKAELALSELTAGKVRMFTALSAYIFDHNEISGKLIAAMEEK